MCGKALILSKADVEDFECHAIFSALGTNKTLQLLDLSHNDIGKSENLCLTRKNLVSSGKSISKMLKQNETLLELNLSWNCLRLGSAVELGNSLAFNATLQVLDIAYNALGDSGSQSIGQSLEFNKGLHTIDISYNNVTAAGASLRLLRLRYDYRYIIVGDDT